ncbi:solute carrier family 25 member 34 isoform X3 [Xiphias gladius]|uniref:solute carrier family 25 member 34 isoform X3 n=1 Tax=Xiphias gladius TaxID=8245 RepID=UPI001A98E102|nr:solute carrier family 25 member 34 isoform X3 [Xiphias gladius]
MRDHSAFCVSPCENIKMFLPFSWILGTSEWTPFDPNPIDCFLRGLVGACGISVLCNLMRVYHFIQTCSDSETESKRRSSSPINPLRGNWRTALQFWSLTLLLSLVGSRVSSLIVLEFSLRAVSAWSSAGMDANGRSLGLDLLLIQCQFSLGCCLTCTLVFLHQGAPHSSLSLFLAAALGWALASVSHSLWSHVARLYPLHSKERYCGKCITLLTSGHTILASLQRVVVLAFALANLASTATVYDHFLSQKDALKFWTPLTLCYTMLVVYIQEDQQRHTGAEALLHTVVLRLGALLVLMLTVGDWFDVLHVFVTFLGEAACLLPSQDLLQAVLKEEGETTLSKYE